MKTYKQFINETPIVYDSGRFDLSHKPIQIKLGDDSKKISTMENGLQVRKTKFPDNYVHIEAADPKKKSTHLRLSGTLDKKKNRLSVSSLFGYHGAKVKAHELYHHIVMNHHDMVSDNTQLPGGVHTWKNLQKYPDIHMKILHHDGREEELPKDFQKNYSLGDHKLIARKRKV